MSTFSYQPQPPPPPQNRSPPEWKITNFDASTTESPDTETEIKRLQSLKTYNLLDQEVNDAAYQEVVTYMSTTFSGTACLNLVDLERIWTVASSNLDFTQSNKHREQRRKDGFCAHTVLIKSDVITTLVVPDASLDPRFQSSSIVLGPPYTRFYVGTPLMTSQSREKIGTLCIIDTQPRHDWTAQQSNLLVQLAAITIQHMEQKMASRMQQPSSAMSPAAAPPPPPPVLNTESSNLTNATSTSTNIQLSQPSFSTTSAETTTPTTTTAVMNDVSNSDCLIPSPQPKLQLQYKETTVQIRHFCSLLEQVMQSFPKAVDLLLIVDPTLPTTLVFHDAKLFQSALAMLTFACQRTETGQICLTVYAKPTNNTSSAYPQDLVFECEDTGPSISSQIQSTIFTTGMLRVVAATFSNYGYRPRQLNNGWTGSTLWFSVPLQTATSV